MIWHQVGWEGEGSPYGQGPDSGVTHHVVDRPQLPKPVSGDSAKTQVSNREYVQPQWIFDSINARMVLPVDLYLPGKPLPVSHIPFYVLVLLHVAHML